MIPDPSPDLASADPTDIEATPAKLRNPELAPGTFPAQQGRPIGLAVPVSDVDNNYASNGHWDRDDLGPVAYVPPVEVHADDGPVINAAGHAPAQPGAAATPRAGR